jgi:hypothetical protein
MTNVAETVTKVVNTMIRDHGADYTSCWLGKMLTEVIEKDVKDSIAREMIMIRLLADGICSQLDSIADVYKKNAA